MQLHLDTNQKELKSHGTWDFPANIAWERINSYERRSFLWHWHKEVELTLVLQGEMYYQVDAVTYHLHAGDGFFVNSNVLHTGYACGDSDCSYMAVTFHPRLLYGYEGSIFQQKYINVITEDAELPGMPFFRQDAWQLDILSCLDRIRRLGEAESKKIPDFEWQLHLLLEQIWIALWKNGRQHLPAADPRDRKQTDRLKTILAYIQTHYAEKITLADIASEVNICQSECCRFFKKHMKESLFDYLLSYRIEQSLPLLADSDLSITEIAGMSGFGSASYYAKIFKEKMGCTPSQYTAR